MNVVLTLLILQIFRFIIACSINSANKTTPIKTLVLILYYFNLICLIKYVNVAKLS